MVRNSRYTYCRYRAYVLQLQPNDGKKYHRNRSCFDSSGERAREEEKGRDKGQCARRALRNTFENSIFFYLCIACDRIEDIVEEGERGKTALRNNLKSNNTFISSRPRSTNRTHWTQCTLASNFVVGPFSLPLLGQFIVLDFYHSPPPRVCLRSSTKFIHESREFRCNVQSATVTSFQFICSFQR